MTPQGESTLSHPLWLENRVATSLGSGTGPNKICVTSQVHGLGLLAQNVLRLGAFTGWGAYQTHLWRGVDTDSRGLQLNAVFQKVRGVSCDSARAAVPQALPWGSNSQSGEVSPRAKA